MTYYVPIMLDCEGIEVVIVGGGSIAARKAEPLLVAGARIRVVSPLLNSALEQALNEGKLLWIRREYQDGDLAFAALAFAATDVEDVNLSVAAEARRRGIPVNVASPADQGTFITPSVVRRGDLVIAVSTSGAGPAISRRITEDLEREYGAEYEVYLNLMKRIRARVKAKVTDASLRRALLLKLGDPCWLERIKNGTIGHWEEPEIDLWIGEGERR